MQESELPCAKRRSSCRDPIVPNPGSLASNGGPTQTIALLNGSPALDAGTATGLSLDQRGISRTLDGLPDIGAFEAQRIAQAITSDSQTSFLAEQPNTFVVTATGEPVPGFSYTGALPPGVTFTSSGVLSGVPALGSDGVYPLVITASNSVLPNATQNFILTVVALPPGTILVNSVNDPAGYDTNLTLSTLGSTVTLRDAFTAANNTPGAQTIVFAPSLAGATIHLTQIGDSSGGSSAFAVTTEIEVNNTTLAAITLARGIAGDMRLFNVKAGGNLTQGERIKIFGWWHSAAKP